MGELENTQDKISRWWSSNVNTKPSQWLQSTLSDLDKKVTAILTLIQEDGESINQQTEMNHKRKQELVKMVQEVYRSFYSLAEEHYDQLQSEPMQTARLSSSISSSSLKQLLHLSSIGKKENENTNYSKPESNSCPESVVEDPDPDPEFTNKTMDGLIFTKTSDQHLSLDELKIHNIAELNAKFCNDKFNNLEMVSWEGTSSVGIQMSGLLEENIRQQAELMKRNDEKREVIRDLCRRLKKVMEENRAMQQQCCMRRCKLCTKRNSPSQASRKKNMCLAKLWGGGFT